MPIPRYKFNFKTKDINSIDHEDDNLLSGSDYRTPQEEEQAQMVQQPQGTGFGGLGNMIAGGVAASSVPQSSIASGGLEAIGTAMDGSTMMGYATPTAAAPAAAPTLMGSTALGSLLPAAGIAAGAWTGGQQLSGMQNAFSGNDLSFTEEAALALPTFGTSFLFDKFGGGKGKDQQGRDAVRANAQQQGWLDDSYMLNLGGDRKYDLGKDGSKGNYNIDFSKPGADIGVQYFKPFAAVMAAQDDDGKSIDDWTGILYNELSQNGTITDPAELRAQALRLAGNFGLTPSQMIQHLTDINSRNKEVIGDDDLAVLSGVVNSLRPGGTPLVPKPIETPPAVAPTPTQTPQSKTTKMIAPMGAGAIY